MATYNWGVDYSYTAGADLSASQYYFVRAGSVSGEVHVASTDGGSVLGVLQNDPKQGEEATVRVLGFSKVYGHSEGGASPLTFGGRVTCASNGMARGYTNVDGGSTFQAGIAHTALASGASVMVTVFLTPPYSKG